METHRMVMVTVLVLGCVTSCVRQESTQVLVVGTIHGGHSDNPNYSYQHLIQILGTYDPDVICVEIRPEDFRKRLYLTEMILASIYGLKRGKEVYPIDSWESGVPGERERLMKTQEYAERVKKEDSLVAVNSTMKQFTEKYGEMEKIWERNVSGYEFFNGDDYNRYVTEMYKISVAVHGDSPLNLWYKTRNEKMYGLIKSAIDKNAGKRIVVLTGSEHKHFFELALAKESAVKLVMFEEILPLRSVAMDAEITDFLKSELAWVYFDTSTVNGAELLYRGALTPLVHGMDMDMSPEAIPVENVDKAKRLLAEWEKKDPSSPNLHFELGWYSFLAGSYRQALRYYEKVLPRLDEVDDAYRNFVKEMIYRNMGLCYDLLGERDDALACYKKGEQMIEKLGGSRKKTEYFFRDLKEKPYAKRRQ